MPKGVEFEEDETDSTCDSDSLLTPSPVFTRALKTNRKFNFMLDDTDSDSDVVNDTPQPKRLRRGICTKPLNSLSDNLNNQQEPEHSAVGSRQNGVSCKGARTKQETHSGNMLKKPQPVDVSSSDNDPDLDHEWLPKLPGGASERTNATSRVSERFSKGEFSKTADKGEHGRKCVTPKLTKQRTFVVPDHSAPPLPTLSPRQKSLQKLVALRKQREERSAKKVTAAASAVKEEGACGNSDSVEVVNSKRVLILDTDSDTSDGEFFASLNKNIVKDVPMKLAPSKNGTKKKQPLPKRGRNKSGDRKKSASRKPKISVVTVSDSESSPDISEEEFERVVNGVYRQHKGRPRNLPGASVAAASTSATATDCIDISEDNRKSSSRNRESSPDISEDEFEIIVNSMNQQHEGRPKNLPGASVAAASASATSTDCIDISKGNNRRRSRNRNSRQSRTEFVTASSLLDTPFPCSPSRPCRRSCPCKSNFTQSTVTSESRRSSPKKKSLTRPDRPSANRWQHTSESEASAGNDSVVHTMRAVTQMEKDEEMARRMQEDMDRQYAAALASGAATTPHSQRQRGSRLPSSIALDDAEEMEARINMLTDWEWQVHVSIVQGTDVPPVPPGEYRQSPDEALDPTLLEHLYSHPDAINLRRTTNNRTTARSRAPGIPPVILPERNIPRPRGATRRRRGGAAAVRRRGNGGLGLDFANGMLNDNLLDNILFTDAQAFFEELSADIRTRRGGLNILDGIRPRRGGGLNMTVADGNDYEELLALEEQLGAVVTRVGLSAEQISRLPLTTYKAATASSDATQCHVCMSDYEEGDRLRLLTCFHSFHCDCIDQWIKDNPTCPVCRIEVQV